MLARLTFLVAFYLAIDVTHPVMPGALVFHAEDSVEVRLAHRVHEEQATAASTRAAERLQPIAHVLVSSHRVVRAPRISRTHAARLHLPSPAPPASPDDD